MTGVTPLIATGTCFYREQVGVNDIVVLGLNADTIELLRASFCFIHG